MKIFCDTNIVMEYLQQRKYATHVEHIIEKAFHDGDSLYISYGSFYTITYLTERYLKIDPSLTKEERITRLRYILNGVLDTFRLAKQDADSMSDGVNDYRFEDLEDSYQMQVAQHEECDILLTINDKHFPVANQSSSLRIMTPPSFIQTFI